MVTAIICDHGTYFTNDSVEDTRAAIRDERAIRIWWFAAHGQRFTELAWFEPGTVHMIRTESDDG